MKLSSAWNALAKTAVLLGGNLLLVSSTTVPLLIHHDGFSYWKHSTTTFLGLAVLAGVVMYGLRGDFFFDMFLCMVVGATFGVGVATYFVPIAPRYNTDINVAATFPPLIHMAWSSLAGLLTGLVALAIDDPLDPQPDDGDETCQP